MFTKDSNQEIIAWTKDNEVLVLGQSTIYVYNRWGLIL